MWAELGKTPMYGETLGTNVSKKSWPRPPWSRKRRKSVIGAQLRAGALEEGLPGRTVLCREEGINAGPQPPLLLSSHFPLVPSTGQTQLEAGGPESCDAVCRGQLPGHRTEQRWASDVSMGQVRSNQRNHIPRVLFFSFFKVLISYFINLF